MRERENAKGNYVRHGLPIEYVSGTGLAIAPRDLRRPIVAAHLSFPN